MKPQTLTKNISLAFELGGFQFSLDHIAIVSLDDKRSLPAYYQHDHTSYELHYLKAGSCILNSSGTTYTLSSGNIFLIPPHLFHRLHDFSNPIDMITLDFRILPHTAQNNHEKLQKLYSVLPSDQILFPSQTGAPQQRLCSYLEQLANLVFFSDDSSFSYWITMSSLCSILMVNLFEMLAGSQPVFFTSEASHPSDEGIIDSFFNLNYNASRTRSDLAKLLHVSPRHLDRILQKRCGMSYQERLNLTRLKTAEDFLLTTDMNIADISTLLGFDNQANFSKFIKRETGKTPSQLRKEKLRKQEHLRMPGPAAVKIPETAKKVPKIAK